MRTILKSAIVLVSLAAGILIASPAHAIDVNAVNVLTNSSLGGANVAVGAVISSGLKTGTTAKFLTTATGTTGVTCTVSTFSGTVLTNPAAGGVATESLTAQSFSSCTSNIFGVTAVQSITVNNLPYNAAVNGTSKAITLTAAGGLIQATVRLSTLLGTVTCVYRPSSGSLAGVTSNTDNSIAFTSQQFTRATGPAVCPGSSFFTARYAPAKNTSVVGSPNVFVQ